ncbi:NADH-quinone oxidoreductase subunit NuoB [Opitutus sp. ER46]|uniref:NADH-quinone oxidoreductase subunit NuoB n=1 Tax=Opitutus sp. ER46 TaxID=2161864 RepID=UPI000D3137C2|nr:NADH-quinone oxidoreductase subunit NuoB [Opitutus sp. ER46]PTX90822.1 hydrogenase [Opitutus sp. ER46]
MFVFDTLTHRLKRGCETMGYPQAPAPALPDRHGGALRVDAAKCSDGCQQCVEVCPTGAITRPAGQPLALDLGKCIFCQACVEVCPPKAITQTNDHRMAVRNRGDLLLGAPGQEEVRLAAALDKKLLKLFGRSLRLRVVSAGGCGGCEADVNVLGTIGWDLSRFGINYVASPRHADGVLVTGCVSRNMSLALKKTYDAVPEPKLVIAVGACAINGGPFIGSPEVLNGASAVVPVDLYIPGCPPHPLTILDGLLRLLDRLEEGKR